MSIPAPAVIPGYTRFMKTAISVPDDLFEQVEKRVRELGISRSEFYSSAARLYVEKLEGESLTAEIDAALAVIRADPAVRAEMDRERAELNAYALRRIDQLTDGEEW